MSAVNAPFGFRGTLDPAAAFVGIVDSFTVGDIVVGAEDGVLSVGYQHASQEDGARQLADQLIESWAFRHGQHLRVDFTQSWSTADDGQRTYTVHLHATMQARASLSATATIRDAQGNEITQVRHSSSFADGLWLVEKARSDAALGKALRHFTQEVVGDDRPLYGIYKAMEELTSQLSERHGGDGRALLGSLVDQGRNYVGDLMETTQLQRHARTSARRLLSDAECEARARLLIEAYAKSL